MSIYTIAPATWTNDLPVPNANTFNKEIHDRLTDIDTNVADKTTAQTLTNKTLTSPVINTGISGTAIATGAEVITGTDNTKIVTPKAIDDATVVLAARTQTLTNKTLTSPVITNKSSTGTDNGVETLTNKTLISPVIAVPMCRVYRSIDQATYTGEQTIIVFDLEDIDTDTMHSLVTNPSRITINTAGTYLIGYSCSFQVRGAGRRLANLVKNSAALSFSQSETALSTEGAHILLSSLLVPLALGDIIELNVYQTSDGYINIIGGTGASSTCMWATRISP